jgi:protein-tyrosine phosphatase
MHGGHDEARASARAGGEVSAAIPSDPELAGLVRSASQAPRRHLAVAGTLNFRDVGGYPVAGGGEIRWRTLLRSDGLERLGIGDGQTLAGLNLRTVLDLRTAAEARLAPSPAEELARLGALTMQLNLLGEDLEDLPYELGAIYDFIIDRRGAQIGAAIRALGRPNAIPALVHCSAGKDRTGIVVGLTLAAIGVPDQVVAADYALSSLYLDPRNAAVIGQISQGTGIGDEIVAQLMASPPELMLRVLARVRRDGGSVRGYLTRHGVSDEDLSALSAALVTHDVADDVTGGESDEPR